VPLLKLCPRCGCSMEPTRKLCTDCQRADDRRRNAKRRESGRTTAAWQRLRLAAFHRDSYACQRCGQTGTRHTLTVHLRPELRGNHRTAALDDLTTLCRSCHGSVDAPRSSRRITPSIFEERRFAPRPRFSRFPLSVF
jgi:5-methylcytosine-specific restriction endonuclease McrA